MGSIRLSTVLMVQVRYWALPPTLTRRNYCMTATVTEDAELGFWSPEALDSLLHNRPDLCQQLLVILGEKMAENYELQEASLRKSKGND
ncbi:MAG: hypothetical protein WA741_29130 [Candidatus Sulfotelmatobacter sp.]